MSGLDLRSLSCQFGDDGAHVGFNHIGIYWKTWIEFFCDPKRPRPSLVCPVELGTYGIGTWIHNPMGHDWPPMRILQRQMLKSYALAHPNDPVIQARADDKAFVEGALHRDFRLSIYTGCFRSAIPFEGESATKLKNRVIADFGWILDAKPNVIGLDSLIGFGHYSQNEEMAQYVLLWDQAEYMFVKWLRKIQVTERRRELVTEPWHNMGEENNHLEKVGNVITETLMRNNAGKWHRLGRYIPGERGDPLYILVKLPSTMTVQQRVDHLNKLQQDFPTCNPVLSFNSFHVGLLDHVNFSSDTE